MTIDGLMPLVGVIGGIALLYAIGAACAGLVRVALRRRLK